MPIAIASPGTKPEHVLGYSETPPRQTCQRPAPRLPALGNPLFHPLFEERP
jgi:hypothetical protein